jgi:two-component system phosphate regulon response regulator OmpR
MSQPLILVVDDDATLSEMLCQLLAREGWAVHAVLAGRDGDKALSQLRPDVVVLDLMLPDANGLDLCRLWRAAHPHLGILMLTARGKPLDKVLGLEIGADDYLTKPFDKRELVARIRALIRRQAPERTAPALMRFDGLTIDLLQREVRVGNECVALTGIEFKLLLELARTPGKPRTREQLSAHVQEGAYRPLDRTVDVQVYRLRRKLMKHGPGRGWIDTVRGEGYVFVPRSS